MMMVVATAAVAVPMMFVRIVVMMFVRAAALIVRMSVAVRPGGEWIRQPAPTLLAGGHLGVGQQTSLETGADGLAFYVQANEDQRLAPIAVGFHPLIADRLRPLSTLRLALRHCSPPGADRRRLFFLSSDIQPADEIHLGG
jgi:hypothetical protein